jgi:hypothetical protein
MIPVIAWWVVRVGKSTLFNRLTRTQDALVAAVPGLTRDRQYGDGRVGDRPFIVVDTGGLAAGDEELDGLMERQAWRAIEEADLVFFLVDAREGLTGVDEDIARTCGARNRCAGRQRDRWPRSESRWANSIARSGRAATVSAARTRRGAPDENRAGAIAPPADSEARKDGGCRRARGRRRAPQCRQVDPDQPHARRGTRARL